MLSVALVVDSHVCCRCANCEEFVSNDQMVKVPLWIGRLGCKFLTLPCFVLPPSTTDNVVTTGRFHPEDPTEHKRFMEWHGHPWNKSNVVFPKVMAAKEAPLNATTDGK